MRPLLPIAQVLPIFQSTFEKKLTQVAKIAFISAIALPIIGCAFSAPLLISTQCGGNQKAEKSTIVTYGLTPLAGIGIGACLAEFVAIGIFLTCISLDLTHYLTFKRHAISYRAIFFPFTSNGV